MNELILKVNKELRRNFFHTNFHLRGELIQEGAHTSFTFILPVSQHRGSCTVIDVTLHRA